MVGFLLGKCEACDAMTCDEVDVADPDRVTCKGCGAKLQPFMGPGTQLSGKISLPGVSKSKGLLAKILISFRPQHNRNGELARHERVIDRRQNRYFEQVTLYDSGEVTHLCDQRLTEHRGHGSAKK